MPKFYRRTLIAFTSAFLLALPGMGYALPLHKAWSSSYRNQPVYVYLCYYQFVFDLDELTTSPPYGQDNLIEATLNAIHAWRHYSQANVPDFRWGGIRDSSDNACNTSNSYGADGTVYIRAYALHADGRYADSDLNTAKGTDDATAGFVQFYGGKYVNGVYESWDWSLNTAEATLVYTTWLMHEWGHVVGFPDEGGTDFGHNSVLRYTNSMHRTPWHEDVSKLIAAASGNWPTPPYAARTGWRIRQKYSTNGINWYANSDNLVEYTNLQMGTAAGSVSGTTYNVLAWVGTNGNHNINTIRGNLWGTTWDYGTKVVLGDRSETGVSLAFGNGKFVLAYAGADEDYTFRGRKLYWKTSTDGMTWSSTFTLPASPDYGVMTNTALAYDSYHGRFILAFINWKTAQDQHVVPYGKLTICTSANPDSGFSNCTSFDKLSWATPGLAVDSSGNFSVTLVDHATQGLNQFWYACGSLNSSGVPSISSWTSQTSWTTRTDLSMTYLTGTNARYVVTYRGQDPNTSGNTGTKASCGTSWGNKTTLTESFPFGGTLTTVAAAGELRLFYGN